MPALGLEFERRLCAEPAEIRRALTDALRETGCEITAEQLTRIEAKRGSRIWGGTFMPAKLMPFVVLFDITIEVGGTCLVAAHFADRHLNIGGKAWGWNQTYRQLFAEVQSAIDRALARLDPLAAASFATPRFWTKGGEIPLLEQMQTMGTQTGDAVASMANDALAGGKENGPAAWKGVEYVTFAGHKGCAVLTLEDTQAHLGVAVMVLTLPGALPPNLNRELELFTARAEQTLTVSNARAVTMELAEGEVPIFEFLHQQASIRDGLPVRTLHTCKTCHFQKVTNEDLARLQTRNQHLRNLVGGVGATISSGGIQPFILLGQLFRMKKLDPDYVCPKCQGLDSDERVVTFCPGCGDMRAEAVLRLCKKCQLDFRSRLTDEPLWITPEAAAALVAPPVPATPPALPVAPRPVPVGAAAATQIPAQIPVAQGPAAAPVAVVPAAEMAFCPFCGMRVEPGFAFCHGCGSRLATDGGNGG